MKKKRTISARIFKNILIAAIIMLYFILINFLYLKLEEKTIELGLKVTSGIMLICGIYILEKAYKKESGKLTFNAFEILVLAGFTLSIEHVVELKKMNFSDYVLASSYIFSVYFIIKAIVIYTKERKEYLKSLSDIREIVDIKPIKKEARKKQK